MEGNNDILQNDEEKTFKAIHKEEDNSNNSHCKYDKEFMVNFDKKDKSTTKFQKENMELKIKGRILNLKVNLKKIHTGRKVIVAVLIFDKNGENLLRFETQEIMAKSKETYTNYPIKFTFPFSKEDMEKQQQFCLKVIAQYTSFPK